jgi:hypothetical protein
MGDRPVISDPVAWVAERIGELYDPNATSTDEWLTAAEHLLDAGLVLATGAGPLDPVADALTRLLGAMRMTLDPLRESLDAGGGR